MPRLFRHLLAIAVLPATVSIVVPVLIARRFDVRPALPSNAAEAVLLFPGIALLLVGIALFSTCVHQFATRGQGTLAPWDPPRNLVIRGPYRFVRNPMISGVLMVLVAEALLLRSLHHGAWAAAWVVGNFLYIHLREEPQLEARFGDGYRRYREHVPRFVPSLRPWRGADEPNEP